MTGRASSMKRYDSRTIALHDSMLPRFVAREILRAAFILLDGIAHGPHSLWHQTILVPFKIFVDIFTLRARSNIKLECIYVYIQYTISTTTSIYIYIDR